VKAENRQRFFVLLATDKNKGMREFLGNTSVRPWLDDLDREDLGYVYMKAKV